MALQSVKEIVNQKLYFIADTPAFDQLIETYQHEQMYYLNTYLFISPDNIPTEIENETSWEGMNRLLLAEITAYQLILNKVIKTTGGAEGDKPGAGARMLKKGEAKPVSAEFEYAKAEDGRTVAMKMEKLLPELKANICRFSQAVNIILPGYCPKEKGTPPPFFVVEF